MTLYLFVPDAQGETTCTGDCLSNWPALIGPATAGEGADEAMLGTTPRPEDGAEQVTYNGWPLYYFGGDTAPGDVNGQGVGDNWYVVDATGTAIDTGLIGPSPAPVASPDGMATLRFSFGTMGSGKSTVALQIHHNLASRDLYGLLLTCLDREGNQVTSRLGVAAPAIDVTPDLDLHALAVHHWPIHYLVCDEAQFYTAAQCEQLARVVDELEVEVYAFGLITDFRGELFEGTKRLLELADDRVPLQVEARCWCGARATHNARVVNGEVTREGETVVVGDTSDPTSPPLFGDTVRYELLCRRHFHDGELGV